jgi:outer membrane protein TolC
MLAWIASLLLLGGCLHYERKPLAPAGTAAALEARSLDSPELKAFLEKNLGPLPEWPRRCWDAHALSLVALYYHPSLEVARAEWRAAQAAELTAGGRPNPALGVVGGYNSSTLAGGNPWLPAINWDLPVETAGKRGYRLGQASNLTMAAKWNLSTSAWKTLSNLRNRLLELAAARARVAPLEAQLTALRAIEQSLEQRLAAGAISRPELAPIRIQIAKLQADLAAAGWQEMEIVPQVSAALGLPAAALAGKELVVELAKEEQLATSLAAPDLRRKTLTTRSDLMALLAEYAASQSALQLEIAKQYPNVNLSPGYEWDQGDHKWRLGLSVELPLFNRNQGPIGEARARRDVIAARFNELQSRIIAEMDQAEAGLRAARKQAAELAAVRQAQEVHRQAVQAAFDAGATDRLELLNAELELTTTGTAETEARIKLAQALVRIDEVMHGGEDRLLMPVP